MNDRGVRAFLAKRDYRGADLDIVCRMTAVAAFLTALVAAGLSPLAPPDRAFGQAGWALLVLIVGGMVLLGLRLLRTEMLAPDFALGAHVAGLVAVAVLVALSGGRESPYSTLLLIWMVLAGASHPPRRVLAVIATGSLLAVLPLFYDDWNGVFVGDLGLRLLIWCVVALLACVWTTQVRTQRVALMEEEEVAHREARVDSLSGLGNRRAFDERLDQAIERSRATGKPLSVIVSDLDGFKVINDSYGHLNGDKVLREAAAAMRSAVRDHDACYRWGGDEFAVLLPGVEQHTAGRVAERVSASVVASCIRPDGNAQTLAWGTAELTPEMEAADLLASADLALMTRKHQREGGTPLRADTPDSETT